MIDEAIAETIPSFEATEQPLEEAYFTLELDSETHDKVLCELYPKELIISFMVVFPLYSKTKNRISSGLPSTTISSSTYSERKIPPKS